VKVLLGGHGDAGDVDAADEIAVVGERDGVVVGGGLAGAVTVDVGDADEIDVPQLRVDARMVLAHVPDADDSRTDAAIAGRHHTTPLSRSSALSAAAPRQPPLGGMIPRRDGAATKSTRRMSAGVAGSSPRMRSSARPGARPLR